MYPQVNRNPTRDEAPPEPGDLECVTDLPRRVLFAKHRVKPELGAVAVGAGGEQRRIGPLGLVDVCREEVMVAIVHLPTRGKPKMHDTVRDVERRYVLSR